VRLRWRQLLQDGFVPSLWQSVAIPSIASSSESLPADLIRGGFPVRAAIRQKGTPYAELGLDDEKLTDDELLDAMLRHPILINRPFVVTERGTRLCRPSEAVLDILPQPQRGYFAKEDGEVVINDKGERV